MIREALIANEVENLDAPHIVICRVAGTNVASYLGPFRTGLDALMAAQAEADSTLEEAFEYRVAALMQPVPPSGRHRA